MIKFPKTCTTNHNRYQYLSKAQNVLKKLHNIFAEWKTVGITEETYSKLPAKLKARFAYAIVLSDEDWERFYRVWKSKMLMVAEALSRYRALLEEEYTQSGWNVDIDDIGDESGELQ